MAAILFRIVVNAGGAVGTLYAFDLWEPAKRAQAIATIVWWVGCACWFSYGDGQAAR